MSLDRFINGFKTDAEIDAFFIGMEESARDNQEALEKRDKMLRDTVEELCEAKQLLKAAVEDFKVIGKALDADCDILINCDDCPLQSGHYNCRSWNHQDEALALIGEDTNVPATVTDIVVGGKSDSWISCEERLPEDNRPVLCYVRDITGEGSGYIIGSCEHSEFWFLKISGNKYFSFPYMRIKVTHWMPLPEPPKEGDST